MQQPEIKKNKLGILWLLPILALGMGLYLAYHRLSQIGPTITIEFSTAEGLEAGKTKIRFKSLDIGTVTNISLSNNFKTVLVHAQMTRNAIDLLKQDSQFWVVKPQVTLNGITGLDTILSGSFIAVAPGQSKIDARNYKGLDTPPLIPLSEPGMRIHLITDTSKGIYAGSPVYYRGFRVGQIETVKYDTELDRINIHAFINSPYDQLINNNTKFWNVSGISIKVGANGANVSMQSLETLALGGITFSTPVSLSGSNQPFDNKMIFTLYANEQDTTQSPVYQKQYYVLYFEDSVRGLTTGNAVEFNGINIGQIIDIRLLYDEKIKKAVIPVLIEIEPERISRVNNSSNNDNSDIIQSLIKNGLEASMETSSLLTGDKIIRLAMYDDAKPTITTDKYSNYPIMPSRNTGITKITDDISTIVENVKNLPFNSLFTKAETLLSNADSTMKNVKTLTATNEIQNIGKTIDNTLKQFDSTLASVKTTSQSANIMLTNLNKELKIVSKQLENTLYGISPESNLYYTLNQTLKSLQKTSKTVDRFMQKLDAKPNSMIFGD